MEKLLNAVIGNQMDSYLAHPAWVDESPDAKTQQEVIGEIHTMLCDHPPAAPPPCYDQMPVDRWECCWDDQPIVVVPANDAVLKAAAELQTASWEKSKSERVRRTMRSITAKLVIGLAITAIGMFGADNSIGTWKRNVAKSKYTPPVTNPIKSLTVVNQASDGGVKVTVTGERQDGTAINGGSFVKYDGKEYPVTGAPWDTISMKQIDANTFTSDSKKTGGKYHMTSRTVISKDGKTMTITTKGTDAEGQPSSGTLIYEKQ